MTSSSSARLHPQGAASSPLATSKEHALRNERTPGIIEIIWLLTILGLIFHVAEPGNPQPADYFLVLILFVPILFLSKRMPPIVFWPMVMLPLFVTYVAMCNLTWAAIIGDLEFLKSTAHYAFGALLFFGYIVMLGERGDIWLRWTFYGFTTTLVLLTILALTMPHLNEGGRLEIFFHNPNQLAYHTLLSASIVVILANRYNASRLTLAFLFACAAFVTAATYSRAGMLGLVILAAIYFIKRPVVIVLLSLPVIFGIFYWETQYVDQEVWEHRINRVQSATTGEYAEDRGLDRIFKHPEHLVLGAGEGHLIRFHPLKKEIHSSAANMIFSYGLIGSGFFIAFGFFLLRSARKEHILLLFPIFAYSLFHHGMRARPFWILLAVVLGVTALSAAEQQRLRNGSMRSKQTGLTPLR